MFFDYIRTYMYLCRIFFKFYEGCVRTDCEVVAFSIYILIYVLYTFKRMVEGVHLRVCWYDVFGLGNVAGEIYCVAQVPYGCDKSVKY